MRTANEVAEEFVALMKALDDKDVAYAATEYRNPVLMAVRSRDAEWEQRILDYMTFLRTCPECGWIGRNTDHYCERCERCKESIFVFTMWEATSVKRLIKELKGNKKELPSRLKKELRGLV